MENRKNEWDEDKLSNILSQEDARMAKQIIMSNHSPHDSFIWPYSKDKTYMVISGYLVATHLTP